jgi:hypothetical protein
MMLLMNVQEKIQRWAIRTKRGKNLRRIRKSQARKLMISWMRLKKSMKSLTYLINLMRMIASLKFSRKQKLDYKKNLQMKLA